MTQPETHGRTKLGTGPLGPKVQALAAGPERINRADIYVRLKYASHISGSLLLAPISCEWNTCLAFVSLLASGLWEV